MTDGVLCLDHIGKVVFANVSVARLMGVADSASLMGRFLPEALKDTHPILRQTLFGTREAQFEVSLPPSLGRGRETPVLISTSKLVDEKGRLRGVVVVLHDLSERKKMEESLKRIEKLEAISEMAAGIAHEIRNPLASIRGSAQELAGAELDREGKERLLRVVVRESDRLNRIVSEFLQYARMPRARTSRCRIKDLLSEVSTLLEKRVESPTGTGQQPDNGCSVKLLIRDDCSCRCDPEQLKQVFLNIGINALEAMENGGVLRIVVSELEAERLMRILGGLVQSPDQRFARIDFIDHGEGIKEADMPRIFDPFFTTKTQGTGLGLSIAQRIIEAHGGKIVARSREGKGSRFSVFLEAVL
jgi:PAS domain S-box-containing protein